MFWKFEPVTFIIAALQEGNMAHNVQQLLKMSQTELDELFKKSPAGKIPDGRPTALRLSRQERNTAKKWPRSSTGSDGRAKFLMQKGC